jgi:FkbM family methyltransferase
VNKKKNHFIENILLRFPKLSRFLYIYSMKNRLGKFLKNSQLSDKINYVYDIGAYKGEWSNFYKKTSLTNSKFILFEANNEHKNELEKKGFQYFTVVLSDKNHLVKFYNNRNSTGDSYYKENTHHHKNLQSREIFAYTLDHIVKQNNLPAPNLVKIDTQGSEIDILKGSLNTIKTCNLIYLECPISKFNQNQLNINDYIDYLNQIGFIPQDICEIHFFHKFMVQVDILFIRKDYCIKNNYNNDLLKSLY